MTRRPLVPLVMVLALFWAGCHLLPSGLQIGGTPLDRVEAKEVKQTAAQVKLLKASQEAAHKADVALAAAPESRPVEVARDFTAEAVAGLDQALGSPSAGDAAQWKDLVRRLLSENEQIRAKADRERGADREQIAKLGDKYASAVAATERAEAKNREYEAKIEGLADIVRKVIFIGGAVVGLWLLSQLLSIAARFNPAFSAAASIVSGIAAPATQFALTRAKAGLAKVGEAIASAEKHAPEIAAKMRDFVDTAADADHKAEIAAACRAAGGNPQ